MARYSLVHEGEEIEVEVEWVGDGYRATIGQNSWKVKPAFSEATAASPGKQTAVEDDCEVRSASSEVTEISSPIAGKVMEIYVAPGDSVTSGEDLLNLEAMKLESKIPAPMAAEVDSIHVSEGESVEEGQKLITLKGV